MTKYGKESANKLLASFYVHRWHKQLIKPILDRAEKKNLSKSDCDMLEIIVTKYEALL